MWDIRGCQVPAFVAHGRDSVRLCSLDASWDDRVRAVFAFFIHAEMWTERLPAKTVAHTPPCRGMWTVVCEDATRPGDAPSSDHVGGDGDVGALQCAECDDTDEPVADPEPAGGASFEQRQAAAGMLARWWRQVRGTAADRPSRELGALERWWDVRRTRLLGPIVAHVRFLQHIYRAHRDRSGWRRGCLWLTAPVVPAPQHRCRGGAMLALEADFIRQRDLSERMMAWYDQYVTVLRRLRAGVSPQVLHLFGGGGGSSEGTRRGGGSGVVGAGREGRTHAGYTYRAVVG